MTDVATLPLYRVLVLDDEHERVSALEAAIATASLSSAATQRVRVDFVTTLGAFTEKLATAGYNHIVLDHDLGTPTWLNSRYNGQVAARILRGMYFDLPIGAGPKVTIWSHNDSGSAAMYHTLRDCGLNVAHVLPWSEKLCAYLGEAWTTGRD